MLYKSDIESFFIVVKDLFDSFNFDSRLIFNVDETFLCPTLDRTKVYSKADMKIARPEVDVDEHITLELCISASGEFVRPLIIFPLKYMPSISTKSKAYFNVSGSSSGWINDEIFKKWIDDFIIHVDKIRSEIGNPNAPALLISDGHGSRAYASSILSLNSANVKLLVIPAHSSTILQPLDLSVNAIFKHYLTRQKFAGKPDDAPARRVLLVDQCRLALDVAQRELFIRQGFERSGLFPFNPNRVFSSELVNNNVKPVAETPEKRQGNCNISGKLVTPEDAKALKLMIPVDPC